MDWNGSTSAFVPPSESSFSVLYNYNNYNPYPGTEVTQAALAETPQGSVVHEAMEKMKYGQQEKKKRLTSKQLESLERSFQEEIKLQPDRKMKLSKELGLQPRQIAVWFQNRRTRWKAKQLQHLYDSLKQEFDAILKEKHKLQQEVMKLKDRLREQASRTQIPAGYTEIISGEETVESMSEGLRSSNKPQGTSYCQQNAEGNYCFTVEEDHNSVPLPYWPLLPYHP